MKNIVIVVLVIVAFGLGGLVFFRETNNAREETFARMDRYFENAARQRTEQVTEIIEATLHNGGEHGMEKTRPYLDRVVSLQASTDTLIAYLRRVKAKIASNGTKGVVANEVTTEAAIKDRIGKWMTAVYLRVDSNRNPGFRELLKKYYPTVVNVDAWGDEYLDWYSDAQAQSELSMLIAEIAGIEHATVTKISEAANSGCVFRFDTHYATAIADDDVLYPGDRFGATILFCHIPDTCEYKVVRIKVEGKDVPVVNGIGKYQTTATTPGLKTIYGKVTTKDQFGNLQDRDVKAEYYVVKPAAVIAPCSLELFAGVGKDFTVALPLVPDDKLVVSVSRGTITGGKGKYTILVNDPGPVKLKVGWRGWEGDKQIFLDSVTYMVNPAR